MVKPVNLYEAKTRLSELVERAAAGEEIIIARAETPRARLVAMPAAHAPRTPGGWQEGVWVADDFDAALPGEIKIAFEGNES